MVLVAQPGWDTLIQVVLNHICRDTATGQSPHTGTCSREELFPRFTEASRNRHDSDESRKTICSGRVFCSRFYPSWSRSTAAQGSAQLAWSHGPSSSPGGGPAERGGRLSQRSTWSDSGVPIPVGKTKGGPGSYWQDYRGNTRGNNQLC